METVQARDEVYEKNILDRLADTLVDGIAFIIDRVRPGWRTRNEAKLTEYKLMLYTLNRSPPGLLGLVLILGFVFVALFGPLLAPLSYDTPLVFCNYKKAYLATPGTVIMVPQDCTGCSTVEECLELGIPPGKYTLIFGADDYGRDLYSRLLYGARTSFIVTVLTMAVGPLIGILLGLVAGYYGGIVDEIIMRITDIFLAFPGLILAIAFSAVLPYRISGILQENVVLRDFLLWLFAVKPEHAPSLSYLVSVVIALWIVWWPGYARLVRGAVLSAREATFVEAARALGVPVRRILFKHILPQPTVSGPLLAYLTTDMGTVILVEAGLSFLGVGAVPPLADWGRMIYDGAQYFPNAWWLVFYPGLAIFLTTLGFYLFGDTLRDLLDPKTRRRIKFKLKRGVEA